jgi:hypothetical protein
MSIVNTKYTTLCIDENINIIFESTSDINLNDLKLYSDLLKNGRKQMIIPIGNYIELDLNFNMIIIKKGYKINTGYIVSSLGAHEYIVKHEMSLDKIIDLLDNLYVLLVNYY